jgi:hypothetical protein
VLSKTGTHDDTVILGNLDVNLVPMLRRLLRGKAKTEKVFDITMGEYKDHFEEAAKDLKLEKHRLVTYQARHGGATRDILLKRRDLEEVRKRGHWRTYSSLRRYEKSGRLQKVLQVTPPDVLAFCQSVEHRVGLLLDGPASAVPCPAWGFRR